MDKLSYDGPIVLAVLDGVALAPDGPGNAVSKARTAWLGEVSRKYLHTALDASGEAVGLVPGQMGNSEVGHNTMGTGQIFRQGVARIDEAFENGEIFESDAWKGAISRITSQENRNPIDKYTEKWYNEEIDPATLHFAGILSDGGVHSHINHLGKLITKAYEQGVRRMRVHAIFDGRDVPPQSEPRYIKQLEEFASQFKDADIRIASGGGRMTTVADRYENDWSVVERGWNMMVRGDAKYFFRSAEEAITALRQETPGIQDQNLPAFVIVDEAGRPVGKINTGDALIYFDFRADRAIEIAQAFTYWDFPYFDRGDYTPDDVYFVGMTEYNSDTHVPEHQLVGPQKASITLSQFLGQHQISQFACSETVKFGHITYYFNGNSYDKSQGEEFDEIDSYTEPFETRPWMRSAEITDKVLSEMTNYKFVRLNYPGGDMVGHTANIEATIVAMEAIDLSLRRIAEKVDELGGCLIVTADHGNAEELIDEQGQPKTSHTTNKVPFILYDNTPNRDHYILSDIARPGLVNLAATIALLIGQNDYPSEWGKPLIKLSTLPPSPGPFSQAS